MLTFALMPLNLIIVKARNIWNTLVTLLISMKLCGVDTLGLVQPELTALLLTFKPSFLRKKAK